MPTFKGLLLAVILSAFGAAVSAQIAFEVASIKLSKSLESSGTLGMKAGGQFFADNAPLSALITYAFDLPGYKVIGGPAWLRTDRYEVVTRSNGTPERQQVRDMVKSLLVERCGLGFHMERRDIEGFALAQAKPGTQGPQLHPSTVDCMRDFASAPRCLEGGFTFGAVHTMKLPGAPMSIVIASLERELAAPVVDATQLTGTFELEMKWSPGLTSTDDAPSLFTALQEQLGLKLEARRVPVDVLVIDRVERPTPD